MSVSRLIIDIVLLVMAAELLAFIIKYWSFSQWNKSWLGRSLMQQKIILFLLSVMFPINSFLMLNSDSEWFKDCQIILFGLFIIALAIDFATLFEAQHKRFDRTIAHVRRLFRRR